jgi:hypothetical protein
MENLTEENQSEKLAVSDQTNLQYDCDCDGVTVCM